MAQTASTDDQRRPDHHLVFGEVGRPGEGAAAHQLEQLCRFASSICGCWRPAPLGLVS